MERKQDRIAFIVLFLVASSLLSFQRAKADDPVSPKSLVFTIYLDGYVFVDYGVDVNQTYPAVNVTLFGGVFEELLVVDEDELPVDFLQFNNTIYVDSLGAEYLRITYYTQDLTSKIGRIWTLAADVPVNVTVELPLEASIVSLSTVPMMVESRDSSIILVMPSGPLEVSYIIEKRSFEEAPDILLWAAVIVSPAVIGIIAFFWIRKRKMGVQGGIRRVKVEDIFKEHGDLREDERETIRLLAEKGGRAYEAEIYERLDIPRTSTWRLIKRLEKMEIVSITKSRRQNIVCIRQEYLD